MSLAHSLCLLKSESQSNEFEQKIFVCIVDNIVVGNISNNRLLDCGMEVFLPSWENLEKILTSPNHKFIKNDKFILLGTIWDGEQFIAPVESEPEPENALNLETNIVCKKINNSYIYYDNNMWIAIKDYTFYIIKLLENYLQNNSDLFVNIFINIESNQNINVNNENKIIKIGINYEQTIVSDEIIANSIEPLGKIDFNNKKYTVRIENLHKLQENDIVFEYSKPNMKNIEVSGYYEDYFNKLTHIFPSVYKSVTTNTLTKNIDSLTLFSDEIPSQRRQLFLNNINNINSTTNHINRFDCFNEELEELLMNTKILVNIHQSEYENTFEEIRVLPALMKKVIVISEVSPLTEMIIYNPMIIWCNYDDLIEKINEVLENYDEYYNKIFTPENINLLNRLDGINNINLMQTIQKIMV
jgi:hypothetical protein